MARPRKENADYFSHDCNMRSHRKIIAIRSKFGLVGYAIYNMLLEHIAGCDYFIAKRNVLEKEILAGDFGVSVAEIDEIVSYCHRLDLVQIDGETLKCRSLVERLNDLIEKRNRERKRVSVAETPQAVAEKPQRKVKESKEKKSKTPYNITRPTLEEVESYFKENGYSPDAGQKAFKYYDVSDRKDSKGNQVKNWKQKMQGVWFKDENKIGAGKLSSEKDRDNFRFL